MARLSTAPKLMSELGRSFNIGRLEREPGRCVVQKLQLMHGSTPAVKCARAGCKRCLVDICNGCWNERRDCECAD